MRIDCPYCGGRGVEEFSFLGDASVLRPQAALPETDPGWAEYVYLRDNPKGLHRELCYHGGGCRAWLVLTRDVRDHAIVAVTPGREMALARRNDD